MVLICLECGYLLINIMTKKFPNSPWFKFFVYCLTTTVICAIAIVWLCNANDNRQKAIVDTHLRNTATVDSLLSLSRKIVVDSALIKCSAKERERLIEILDRNNPSVEINQAADEIHTLLELEFNRIQSEYEVLALWGGLITVIFLVFSFYSIFRGEEMTRQGNAALGKLDKVTEDAEKKSASIDKMKNDAQNNLNDAVKTQVESMQQKFEGVTLKVEEISSKLDNIIKDAEKSKDIIDNKINELIDLISDNADQKIKEIDAEYSKVRSEIDRLLAVRNNETQTGISSISSAKIDEIIAQLSNSNDDCQPSENIESTVKNTETKNPE